MTALKAAHSVGSSIHEYWEISRDDGSIAPVEFHAYPKECCA
jgi:hypothetical protein